MSTYQYVYFAAVDRALSDKQLEYMSRQSTRAEVTRWQFKNEYHYGDFRGNAPEMMRRGYDVHLHYANYGVRTLMFRLPLGLPMTQAKFKAFELKYCIEWKKDSRGKGGALSIAPESDAGDYDEDYFDFDRLVTMLPKIRESLIAGDLRPLYLAWLACVYDEDAKEPPVPGGLKKLPVELKQMCEFYAISDDIVAAAAKNAPAAPGVRDQQKLVTPWLEKCTADDLRSLLHRVLDGEGESVRAESLAAIRKESDLSKWPMAPATRTYGELQAGGQEAAGVRTKREEQSKERARLKRLDAIKADPLKAITEAEKLVKVRSTDNYYKAAAILAELRDALGPTDGPRRADTAAKKLVRQHPTLSYLKRALKEQGLSYK